MARLALLALLALAFSTVALAAPQQDVGVVSDLHARAGNQFYLPCGTWFLASRDSTRGISS